MSLLLGAHLLLGAVLPAPAPDARPSALQEPGAPAEELVVGTRVAPPFVMDVGDGTYDGLTVRLWDHVARELGLAYRFEERDIEGLLEGVEDGSLFASAAALTVTSERERRVDFTHPFFVTGLGIAVPYQAPGLAGALRALVSPRLLWVLALLAGLLLFWGLLIWLFERRRNREQFGGSAAQGIGSGFWWAAVTMTTVGYGDKAPETLGGRLVGLVWMFAAVILISFFTGTIASSLTVSRLDGRVSGPQDLPFARVGVLEGAAAAPYLEGQGVRGQAHPTVEAGLAALGAGALDAFVHDAPILRHHAGEGFRGRVRVLPGTFMHQYYAVALPLGSPERQAINLVLLDFLESEEWERLVRSSLGEG